MRVLRWVLAALTVGVVWSGLSWLIADSFKDTVLVAVAAAFAYFTGRWHEHEHGGEVWWLERLRGRVG